MKLEDWKASRLVYSTDASGTAPGRAAEGPRTRPAGPPPPLAAQKVLVKIDRKGRRGKSVTVVEGVVADEPGLESLAKRLKSACGSGGTIKDGRIEIQGEHRDKILGLLAGLGYRPKPSGG